MQAVAESMWQAGQPTRTSRPYAAVLDLVLPVPLYSSRGRSTSTTSIEAARRSHFRSSPPGRDPLGRGVLYCGDGLLPTADRPADRGAPPCQRERRDRLDGGRSWHAGGVWVPGRGGGQVASSTRADARPGPGVPVPPRAALGPRDADGGARSAPGARRAAGLPLYTNLTVRHARSRRLSRRSRAPTPRLVAASLRRPASRPEIHSECPWRPDSTPAPS